MVSPGSQTWPAIAAVILVSIATLGVGALGLRLSRTTSDFYVASRVVGPRWNASAIGGEYLSAASFLGISGLILLLGIDALWYPVGYTAGYLVLLALVAAPLRRSGAYTLPDFAETRLGSLAVRRAAALLVVVIGWLYLLPQFEGAGLAMRTVTGAPKWVGTALVVVVVVLNVAAGGMRSITFVQAFQFWLKLTAIAIPVLLLALAWRVDGGPDPAAAGGPVARTTTTVQLPETVRVAVQQPITLTVHGEVNGQRVDGPVQLEPGTTELTGGASVTLRQGQPVPQVVGERVSTGPEWARPGAGAAPGDHPLYRVYSLLLALLFGTMGLPHVLVRFYTNPDGRAARRTTFVVIGLLSAFYLFPPFYGAMGRVYAPDLLMAGRTDAVVLLLPARMLPATLAQPVAALLTAGAFAAFLSTSSGLTVSVSGVLSQDLLRGRFRGSVRGFQLGAVIAVAVPGLLSLATLRTSLADTVGLAFAVAASTFCPLLVLGVWWRRLTAAGAVAGLAVGGGLSSAAVLVTIAGGSSSGLLGALLSQPAAWSVPLAFATMVGVSMAGRPPAWAGRVMVRLHLPEGLARDPDEARPVPARAMTPVARSPEGV